MRLGSILVCAAVAWAAGNADIDKLFRPAGKANIVFFISSDCPISNSYAPEIQRLCGDYGSRGVSCSLSYEDVEIDASSLQKHLTEYRLAGIPAVIDNRRKISSWAKATVTPEAVVVDTHGEIRYRGRIDNFYAALGKPRQQVTAHDLRDALEAVLSCKPVPNPETKALGCYIVPPDILKK